jgi:hypothetical protein
MPLVSSVPIIASLRRLSQGCKPSFYTLYLNNYLLRSDQALHAARTETSGEGMDAESNSE